MKYDNTKVLCHDMSSILDKGNNLFDIEGAVNMLNKQLLTTDSLKVGHRAQIYVPQMK